MSLGDGIDDSIIVYGVIYFLFTIGLIKKIGTSKALKNVKEGRKKYEWGRRLRFLKS